MSFPVVEGFATTEQNSPVNPIVINLPTGIQAGELLVATVIINGNHSSDNFPAGWTLEAYDSTTGPSDISCWTKVATGSEGSTVSFNNSIFTANYSAVVYRISNYRSITRIDSLAEAFLGGITPGILEMPALNMSYGQRDYLYLFTAGWRRGDYSLLSGPANFTQVASVIPPTNAVGDVSLWSFKRNFANPTQPATETELVTWTTGERLGVVIGIDSGDGLVFTVTSGISAAANTTADTPSVKKAVFGSASAEAIFLGRIGDIFEGTATFVNTATTSGKFEVKKAVKGSVTSSATTTVNTTLRAALTQDLTANASSTFDAFAKRLVSTSLDAVAESTGTQFNRVPFTGSISSVAVASGNSVKISPVAASTEALSTVAAQITKTVFPALSSSAQGTVDIGLGATLEMSGSASSTASASGNAVRKVVVATPFDLALANASLNTIVTWSPKLSTTAVAEVTGDMIGKQVSADIVGTASLGIDSTVRFENIGSAQGEAIAGVTPHILRRFDATSTAATASAQGAAVRTIPVFLNASASATCQVDAVREVKGDSVLSAESATSARFTLRRRVNTAAEAIATARVDAKRYVLVASSVSATAISNSEIWRINKVRGTLNVSSAATMAIGVQTKYFLTANITGRAGRRGRISKVSLVYADLRGVASVEAFLRGSTGNPSPDWRRAYVSRDLRKIYI